MTRRPKSPLGDDTPKVACLLGISGNGFVRDKVQIALDWETWLATHGGQLDEADIAEFGIAETEFWRAACYEWGGVNHWAY
jgi:hypothetical protein